MSGDIGWLTLTEAEDYFSTQRLETAHWDALGTVSGKDQKTAVLMQAYNRIRRCKDFSIPATPTAAQLEALGEAQCETAYYLALHGEDEDIRKGLHAQGVIMANVAKEVTAGEQLHKLPLPPIVYDIMEQADLLAPPLAGFYAVEIGRDENKDIDEDVTDD